MVKQYRTVRKKLADGTSAEYHYHRKTKERLDHKPGTKDFDAALLHAGITQRDNESETINQLIAEYRRSPNYTQLKHNSKRAYERCLELFRPYGSLPVSAMRRRHITRLRDSMADHPAMANLFVRVVSTLLAYAVESEYRDDNPAIRIKRLQTGHWSGWPQDTLDHFIANARPLCRLAALIALYTGQRFGDVLDMQWSAYDGTGIQVRQQKTGAELWIPCHQVLKVALAGANSLHEGHILSLGGGSRILDGTFRAIFRKEQVMLGAADYQFHGLRKNAVTMLAEAGCSPHEIAAISGHASLAMIQLYTQSVEQKRLASAAIKKLEVR